MKFTIDQPDYVKSPYTGMTRKHWIEAAKFLMEGAFAHLKDFHAPMVFTRYETEITYPQPGQPDWRYCAERFEGLARTMSIAALLIKENPDTVINGYKIRDYYASQILEGTKPGSPVSFGILEEVIKEGDHGRAIQQTVECGLLVIILQETKKQIWDRYTSGERNQIAEFLSQYGHCRTNQHNWRFFNILILTFLKLNGYPIDEQMLKDHLQNIMTYYAEDGWYRDGDLFDYYSPWAFQFYAPIWCSWYGYEFEPEIAAVFEKNFSELMKNYTSFFDSKGRSIMWGRSGVYRSCASAPLAAAFFLKNPSVDPGLARRILSGNLLQFITREEMFMNQIPCLGFYGPFSQMVQSYSCAASPFWMGKSFLALAFDENAPLWSANESGGIWEGIENSPTVFVDGPGISVTNHGKTGTSEIRTAKVLMNPKSPYMPSYSRLSFNSALPWEAFDGKGPEAMNYSLRRNRADQFSAPNLILYGGEKDGVLYRRINFDFDYNLRDPLIDLADIEVPYGMIRVDRPRIPDKPYELMLGHYGLPHVEGKVEVTEKVVEGKMAVIAKTKSLQTAFIAYSGWDRTGVVERSGVSAITEKSTLSYALSKKEELYRGIELLITILLHREDDREWKEEELMPIEDIQYIDVSPSGGPCGVELHLRDGRKVTVDFGNMEGRLRV